MLNINENEFLLAQIKKETNKNLMDSLDKLYDGKDSDNQSTQTNSELIEDGPKSNPICDYLMQGKEKSHHIDYIDSNNFVKKEEYIKNVIAFKPVKTETSDEKPIETLSGNNCQIITPYSNDSVDLVFINATKCGKSICALYLIPNSNTYHLRFYTLENEIFYGTNFFWSLNIYNCPFMNNSFIFNNYYNNGFKNILGGGV